MVSFFLAIPERAATGSRTVLPTTRRRSRATGGFTPTAGLPRPPLPVG